MKKSETVGKGGRSRGQHRNRSIRNYLQTERVAYDTLHKSSLAQTAVKIQHSRERQQNGTYYYTVPQFFTTFTASFAGMSLYATATYYIT